MTPTLLQQARGALSRAASIAEKVVEEVEVDWRKGDIEKANAVEDLTDIQAALTSLDAFEALSPYDKAIEALAPYLPLWVKWVAIHDQAHVQGLVLFDKKPELSKMGPWWNAARRAEISEVSPLCLPPIDWRESLREIRSGHVVPQGEGDHNGSEK